MRSYTKLYIKKLYIIKFKFKKYKSYNLIKNKKIKYKINF